jgi:redox-sensitive bicupin YhaK (pirin superfamily)
VRPHPHIGLSTVSYLFSGEIMHRDSLGSVLPVRPAGGQLDDCRARDHAQRALRARAGGFGDHLHGIQAWVALPTETDEETDLRLSRIIPDAICRSGMRQASSEP